MARTFTCNEEIIVVSKGTEDIGKLAMLGNGGKFDPSVIPSTENKPVCCRVSRSNAQSIPNSAETAIVFDTVVFASDNMHDMANPSKIVIPSDGIYQITGQVNYAVGGSGIRTGIILLNGTITIAGQDGIPNTVNTFLLNAGTMYKLNKGDYIQLVAYQTSGGTLDAITISGGVPFLAIYKISD